MSRKNVKLNTLLIISLVLTGCVNYVGIHGSSKKWDQNDFETPHHYPSNINTSIPHPQDWWAKFHDPVLEQLIFVAIKNAPDMQIAQARVRQTKFFAQQAGASFWPSVDLSGFVERERFSRYGLVPPPFNGRTYNFSELGLNFNYELDFWGKNRESLKSALSNQKAAQAEMDEAQLIITTTVANTYFQLRNAITQVELAATKWQIDKNILTIALDRARHGVSYAIPINSLETNVQVDKQLLEQLQQTEVQTRNQVAVLIGKNPFSTQIDARRLVFHEYKVTLPSALPAHLLAKRPDIYAAKWRVEAAASQINVARARFFPDINLGALFSYQKAALNNLFSAGNQNNYILGAIDLPIFDANARKAQYGQRYAEYDEAVNIYNKTILNALREVCDQLSMLNNIKAQMTSQKISVMATQKNYQLLTSRFKHGIADYTDVLQRKKLLLQQQSELAKLQTMHLQSVVATYKALGGHDV